MVDGLFETGKRKASAKAEAPARQQLTSEKGKISGAHGR